ncbi:hypothetical protein CMI37_26145 [Candidatus Pacearchaeota archaeon]|nr:hypothetical protein [Candidatus Pacearchaeota archaeon]|tara:strand:- start:5209 stop:6147 length:939 start_codon:yes stop_codon:yes gene_type:complete
MNEQEIEIDDRGFKAIMWAYNSQRLLVSDSPYKSGEINDFVDNGVGGDRSLRGDWESEEAVIGCFKKYGFPARVVAEEHGEVDIVPNPKYLAVLDGFDGSSALKLDPQARGGTMLAIADNLEPRYSDFVFGGLTEFTTKRVLWACRGRGYAFLRENPYKTKDNVRKIGPIEREPLGQKTKIYLDDPDLYEHASGVTSGLDEIGNVVRENFTMPLQTMGHKNLRALNSSAAMCLDLVLGKVDAVGGVIAKGVFEPPAEYVLLDSVGGCLVGQNGQIVRHEKWREFGRPLSPLMRVANPQLAQQLWVGLGKGRS